MSEYKKTRFHWRTIPFIKSLLSVWQNWRVEQTSACYRPMEEAQARPDLLPYPIDMFSLLTLPGGTLDEVEAPYKAFAGKIPATYHPTSIAQSALAHWNIYLANGGNEHKETFMSCASWLLAHEVTLSNNAGGWPIPFALPAYHAPQPYLSALTQGNVISVLMRAYQLTTDDTFLHAACRAVHTFELDILDGGVCAPIGEKGVFFEEVAVYPASHILKGHILALIGLYDYMMIAEDSRLEGLIEQSMTALHGLIDEYDTGYWTRSELLHKRLASRLCHSLHAVLLEVLAGYSRCEHCMILAARWYGYQRHFGCCLRYLIASRASAYLDNKLKSRLQRLLFGVDEINRGGSFIRVCVPVVAFPVTGGTRTVLTGVAQVMSDQWQMAYLTHRKGSSAEGLEVETFGRKVASPWQFPSVWLYCLTGWGKLFALLRRNPDYGLILPQDAVFTGAFAALVGKLAGVRVVCMDHGNLTLLDSRMYRDELLQVLSDKHWIKRVCARPLFIGYWPTLNLLARITARFTDHFLIPGVVGDGVEDACEQLKIPPSRITRFNSMIDVEQYGVVNSLSRANIREKNGIATDAIVVAMVCRLSPEKGLNVALESIHQALSHLSSEQSARVRVIIAGDGPLRAHLEEDIHLRGLSKSCMLWGEIAKPDVISLLSTSDIFLYTSTRGACLSMAVLEAMASGCAVIASTRPLSNAYLLADGRGIAVTAEDVEQTSQALVLLLNDLELCHQMGSLARNFVAIHHSPTVFKRVLMRMTYWSPLDELLTTGIENEG